MFYHLGDFFLYVFTTQKLRFSSPTDDVCIFHFSKPKIKSKGLMRVEGTA